MIVIVCMFLHNRICDSKLCHEHFDKLDNDKYVQPSLPFTGVNTAYDGIMAATRDAIAINLIP